MGEEGERKTNHDLIILVVNVDNFVEVISFRIYELNICICFCVLNYNKYHFMFMLACKSNESPFKFISFCQKQQSHVVLQVLFKQET